VEIHLDLRFQQFRLPGYACGREIGEGKKNKTQAIKSRNSLPISEKRRK